VQPCSRLLEAYRRKARIKKPRDSVEREARDGSRGGTRPCDPGIMRKCVALLGSKSLPLTMAARANRRTPG